MSRFFGSVVAALALVMGSLLVATPAQAATVSWDGELVVGDATWNRPTCFETSSNVEWFEAQSFMVDVTGTYTLEMVASARKNAVGNGDGYFLLYEAPFESATPYNNCLSHNDDGMSFRPRITHTLTAGTVYTLVTTQCCDGITLSREMTYRNQISGPGNIALGNPAASELIVGPSAVDTDTDTVLTATPVSNLLGVDLSGTVTFSVDGVRVGDAQVDTATGIASLNIGRALSTGTHTITADYSGVFGKTLPSSGTITLTKSATQTTTTLDIAPAEIFEGAQAIYTATVSGAHPTGSVEFYSGTTLVGVGQIVNGVARITVSPSVGTYTVTANYLGDANYSASSSSEVSLLVKKPEAKSELIVGPSAVDTDTDTVLTATPVSNLLGVDLSGTVTFSVDGVRVGDAQVDTATGVASLNIGKTLSIGSHAITADYSGVTGKTLPSSGTITLTKSATQTTTTLDIAPAEIVEGEQASYTAIVSGVHPTGSVEFYSGTTLVGVGQVADGVASITVSPSVGTYTVTANYVGDANYSASRSSEASLLVKTAVKPEPEPKPEPKPVPQASTPLADTGVEDRNFVAPVTAGVALASGLVLMLARRKTVK